MGKPEAAEYRLMRLHSLFCAFACRALAAATLSLAFAIWAVVMLFAFAAVNFPFAIAPIALAHMSKAQCIAVNAWQHFNLICQLAKRLPCADHFPVEEE